MIAELNLAPALLKMLDPGFSACSAWVCTRLVGRLLAELLTVETGLKS